MAHQLGIAAVLLASSIAIGLLGAFWYWIHLRLYGSGSRREGSNFLQRSGRLRRDSGTAAFTLLALLFLVKAVSELFR